MDRIQQIGLANAVAAADPHNAFGKIEILLKIILELKNRYGTEIKTQVKICKASKIEEKQIANAGAGQYLAKSQEC